MLIFMLIIVMLIFMLSLTVAFLLGMPFHQLVIGVFEDEIDRVHESKRRVNRSSQCQCLRFGL